MLLSSACGVPAGRSVSVLWVVILATASASLAQSVTVTSPNGGENWQVGTQRTITWSSAGSLNPGVDIQYTTDNGNTWNWVVAGTPNDGSHSWTIPNTPSTQCKVKVIAYPTGGGYVLDVSNSVFTIAHPTVTVTSPNGGESWIAGTVHNITWSTSGTLNSGVDIQYTTNGGSSWNLIVGGTPNDGSYAWTVPLTLSASCRVKVLAYYSSYTYYDESNAYFTIAPPTVTVTAPNGGENWQVGTQRTITWSSVGSLNPGVDIQYTTDNGNTWNWVVAGTPNNGSYTWTVPNTPSAQCRVKVLGYYSGGTALDVSNGSFTISTPTVTVTSPNGGESWIAGTVHNITWTSSGTLDPYVDIQYSTDDGNNWFYLTTTPNNGQYAWTVHPDAVSSQVRLKVLGYYQSAAYLDVSDAALVVQSSSPRREEFGGLDAWTAIRPDHIGLATELGRGLVTLTYPVGAPGNGPGPGHAVGLQSTARHPTGGYAARLRAAHCRPYFQGPPREGVVSGFFTYWCSEHDANGLCLGDLSEIDIELLGHDPHSVYLTVWTRADSRASRWINMRTGEIRQVNPGETSYYPAGYLPPASRIADFDCTQKYYVYGFTWSASNLRYFIYNNDRQCELWQYDEAGGIPSQPAYVLFNVWHTPDWLAVADPNPGPLSPPASPATVAVDWLECPDPVTPPSVQVTQPNGGENWLAGSTRTIAWTTSGTLDPYVDIQYTTDNGQTWAAVTDGTPDDGTYAWIIPNTPATQCKVKVLAYADNHAYYDVSDGVFTISAYLLGDLNCDGLVDGNDLAAFVLGILDPVTYAARYPGCDRLRGDYTGDGLLNEADIASFVQSLTGS